MELDVDPQPVKVLRLHQLADRDADDLVEGDGRNRKVAALAAREDEQRRDESFGSEARLPNAAERGRDRFVVHVGQQELDLVPDECERTA